ncbi:polysaccharide pyruvyl transferase family protein [Emcibacter sp.]|uniref:polysaccharide pyruvyl transferase family protein n=1 Tax=Emcibacter sp. TaxID=1979954 RepID=UPI002AA61AFE|nr:polysaccharide pyruvyl transferase family protein [Emcibacter sp.]
MKYTEVKGVGCNNKGAYLLLRTVMQWGEGQGNHVSELAADFRALSASQARNMGIKRLTWAYFKSYQWPGQVLNALICLVPSWLRRKYDLVTDREIQLVLDASGFLYSDQWGSAGAERLVMDMERRKKRGIKYILLPQAFGPFSNSRTVRAMQYIAEHADLIYARDRVSYEHLNEIGAVNDRVKISPDITIGLVPESNVARQMPGDTAIIPNVRMLDKGKDSEKYYPYLHNAIKELRKAGFNPFFLIHEAGDVKIAEEINEQIDAPLEIVAEDDPVVLKTIIRDLRLVVGSRFHGLVSGLSQSVPCLAVGWSHKYEMLFEDFGVPDKILTLDNDVEFAKQIDMLKDREYYSACKKEIEQHALQLKKQVAEMWNEIEACINE